MQSHNPTPWTNIRQVFLGKTKHTTEFDDFALHPPNRLFSAGLGDAASNWSMVRKNHSTNQVLRTYFPMISSIMRYRMYKCISQPVLFVLPDFLRMIFLLPWLPLTAYNMPKHHSLKSQSHLPLEWNQQKATIATIATIRNPSWVRDSKSATR